MKTTHRIIYKDSRNLSELGPSSINLTITSPPYPMIEMWDQVFSQQNKEIEVSLKANDGDSAFELMHLELDKVWKGVYDLLTPGGFACINIGDATRTLDKVFKLYPNHARILTNCIALGFHDLPEIIWRKQSNKPNKFMGSGMLPAGAYVTQEHEYILILRKNEKKEFTNPIQKIERQRSAFFWEERNAWFSDVWEDLKGDRQVLGPNGTRERSAAYPFELCYRLISMFSLQGSTVLDPFSGTGTTTLAAMASGRNSIGFEIDSGFKGLIEAKLMAALDFANEYNQARIKRHKDFVSLMKEKGKELGYINKHYGFPVMTSQEVEMRIPVLEEVKQTGQGILEVSYS